MEQPQQPKKVTEVMESLTPKQTSANHSKPWDDIILTDEETSESLGETKKRKYYRQRSNEYWEKVKAEPIYLRQDSVAMRSFVLKKLQDEISDFVLDSENEHIFHALVCYFAGDETFEKLQEGFSLEKGIMMIGGVGVGKTSLMKAFTKNVKQSFGVVSCQYVASKYNGEGNEGIESYFATRRLAVNEDIFGHKESGTCFDDLGTETIPSKNFGNDKNVMMEIIMSRYESKMPFYMTHITTNKNAAELEAMYGSRVRDRMREMFNQIVFTPQKTRRG